MEDGCLCMKFDAASLRFPAYRVSVRNEMEVGGGRHVNNDVTGVNHCKRSGPAVDTDLVAHV